MSHSGRSQNGTKEYFRNGLRVELYRPRGAEGSGFLLWGEPGVRWGYGWGCWLLAFFWQAVKVCRVKAPEFSQAEETGDTRVGMVVWKPPFRVH